MHEPSAGRGKSPGLLFFGFGFAATAGQVLLLRLGVVLGGGNELVLGAYFGAWFLGIAAGAAAGRRVAWKAAHFRWLAGLFPSLVLLNALAVAAMAAGAAPAFGHLPSLGRGVLLAAALAFLPGAGIGISFPAGAASAGGIARLFLLESLGSAAGGTLATLLFLRVDPSGALGVLSGLGLGILPGRARLLAPAAAVALWGGWGALSAHALKAFHPVGRLVAEVHSPYQHILLTELGGQYGLYLNGQAAGQSPDPAAAERFRIVRRIAGGTGEAALVGAWPAVAVREGVVWIQPDAALVRLREDAGAGPRSVVTADPRAYLARQEGRFSLLVLDLPPPMTVAQERLFTVEFFGAAARALRPDGLLVLALPATENYWGEETARLVGGIQRTLKGAFPGVVAAVGPMPLLLASPREGLPEGRLEALRAEEGTGYAALFPRERMEAFNRRLNEERGRAAGDAHPFAYMDAIAVREKMDGQVPVAGTLLGLAPWMLVPLALAAAPYWPRRRRPLFQVFSTGALGIGTFLLLSIRYQASHGTYYGAVGLLTGLFMAGLAASAPLGRRMAARPTALWIPDAAALALLALVWAVPSGPAWGFGILFALSGAVTGLPFVHQGIRFGDDPAAAARMQFHDHLGAAAGAVATGLLLMPLLGLPGTILALAGMKAVSLGLNLRPIPA